ncbi:MAG TPA: nuclear transport factor 2 family protein [Polyangiaceae bacterium]|nr:nuclear transport factor 2 family protein [Polyangiaceae bacterium]
MHTKTLLAFVALTCSAVACGGEPPPPPAPPPPPPPAEPPPAASATEAPPPAAPAKPSMADLVPQTLKNVTDAFNAHDSQKFAANFTADAVQTEYGVGEAHGRDEIAKNFQRLFDASSDAKGGAARLFAKGNVIAVDWVTTGTMTGDLMGMKATKKPFGLHRLVITSLNDDGLMTGSHEYTDELGAVAQMKGMKEAPPVATLPATTEWHVAKNTPDEDKLADWMKTENDAFNKDDPKALSALLTAEGDVTFYFAGAKVLKAGKDFDKFNADFFKAIPKAQFAISSVWAADGYVIAERTITGALKGRLGPAAPTGKDVTLHAGEIFQATSDGKVEHAWAFGNIGEVMPPPPPPKVAAEKKPAAGDKADKATDKKPAAPATPAPKK